MHVQNFTTLNPTPDSETLCVLVVPGSYNFGQLDDLDDYLRRDASYGIESAAILWGCAPPLSTPCQPPSLSMTPRQHPPDLMPHLIPDLNKHTILYPTRSMHADRRPGRYGCRPCLKLQSPARLACG